MFYSRRFDAAWLWRPTTLGRMTVDRRFRSLAVKEMKTSKRWPNRSHVKYVVVSLWMWPWGWFPIFSRLLPEHLWLSWPRFLFLVIYKQITIAFVCMCAWGGRLESVGWIDCWTTSSVGWLVGWPSGRILAHSSLRRSSNCTTSTVAGVVQEYSPWFLSKRSTFIGMC